MPAQSVNPAGSSEVQELHIRVLGAAQTPVEPGKFSQQALTVEVSDGQGTPVSSAAVLFRLPADGTTGVFSDGSRVTVLYTDAEGHATVKGINWSTTPGTAAIRVTASKGSAHAGLLVEQAVSPSKSGAVLAPSVSASTPVRPQIGQPADLKSKTPEHPVLLSSSGASAGEPIAPPSVQITNGPQMTGAGGSSKKWLWIGLGAAAAAGMAFAFVGKKGSTTASTPSGTATGTTIGTPSISIGHP